jgi:hypothetical protein
MNARMSCLRILLIDIVIGAVVGCSALYGSSQPSTNAVMRAVPLATWSESGQRPEPAIRIVDSIEETPGDPEGEHPPAGTGRK